MIDGVHRNTPDFGPPVHPSRPAGLADRDKPVVLIADFADRGVALLVDPPYLAGRQLDEAVCALLGRDDRRGAGRPAPLAALAPVPLDVVDIGTQRYVLQG